MVPSCTKQKGKQHDMLIKVAKHIVLKAQPSKRIQPLLLDSTEPTRLWTCTVMRTTRWLREEMPFFLAELAFLQPKSHDKRSTA